MKNNTFNDAISSTRSLRRVNDGTLGGVAAGVANYFGIQAKSVRIAFVVLSLLGGGGLALYLAGWALIPEEGSDTSLAAQMFRRTPTQAS
jgi:phage shock protein PspC (stress-responsive transcriptional regulator)